MTPQLQQAIKPLQMTNLDIQSFPEEQALENPFLEVATSKPDNIDHPGSEAKAISVETANPTDLADCIHEGTALADDPTAHCDFENRFESNGLILAVVLRPPPWEILTGIILPTSFLHRPKL